MRRFIHQKILSKKEKRVRVAMCQVVVEMGVTGRGLPTLSSELIDMKTNL